jgi:hypothetical protein
MAGEQIVVLHLVWLLIAAAVVFPVFASLNANIVRTQRHRTFRTDGVLRNIAIAAGNMAALAEHARAIGVFEFHAVNGLRGTSTEVVH